MKTRYFEYFIGPQHPGVTGNMSYHLWARGDEIVKMEPSVGYLHRGFEKLMEQREWIKNVPMVPRICVPEPDVNEILYAMGVEELAGITPPERAQYIRVLVLEMARMAAYLFYFGGVAGALGLYTIPQWTIGDRDYILDRFEELTGGRIYHIYIQPGGVRRDIPEGFRERVLKLMDYLERRLKDYDRLMFYNAVVEKRTKGMGVIEKEYALQMGVTGPNLRASGYPADVRKDDPYLIYGKLEFDVPVTGDGDIYSRMLQRRLEFEESIKIVRQVLDSMPEGPIMVKLPHPLEWKVPQGDVYVKVESSKGEYGYYIVSDGGVKPYRIHVRGPSMPHCFQAAKEKIVGMRIADVPVMIFSLDICPPDIER